MLLSVCEHQPDIMTGAHRSKRRLRSADKFFRIARFYTRPKGNLLFSIQMSKGNLIKMCPLHSLEWHLKFQTRVTKEALILGSSLYLCGRSMQHADGNKRTLTRPRPKHASRLPPSSLVPWRAASSSSISSGEKIQPGCSQPLNGRELITFEGRDSSRLWYSDTLESYVLLGFCIDGLSCSW